MTTLEAAKEKLWQKLHEEMAGRRVTDPVFQAAYNRYVEAVTELEREAGRERAQSGGLTFSMFAKRW